MTLPVTTDLLDRKSDLLTQHNDACVARDAARKAGDAMALASAKANVEALAEILEETLTLEAEPLLAERTRLGIEQAALKSRLMTVEQTVTYSALARQIEALNDQLRPLYRELIRVCDSRVYPVRGFKL